MAKAYANLMLRISPELADSLQEAAQEDYRTMTATVRLALEEWLERRRQDKAQQPKAKVRAV